MGALVLLIATAGSAAITAIGWLGVTGRLPRNRWAGIRTRYSLSSDERWNAVHRAGGPALLYAGVAGTASGLAFLPFAAFGALSDGLAIDVAAAQAVVIGAGAVGSAIVGTRRARATVG